MRMSFWKLITSDNIVIPSIQRDYAQGRSTPQAASIRNKFIDALLSSARSAREISLDFIYGKLKSPLQQELLESNRENMERILKTLKSYASNVSLDFEYALNTPMSDDKARRDFIPLDGQQRLTTLFILHWYILFRLGETAALEILSRFQYRTRTGSRDFIKTICALDPELMDFTVQSLASEIINQKAFYLGWQKDPTVQGILTVINLVHAKCASMEVEMLCLLRENLIEKECIQFDFLDLRQFELTDELYVKMNARGKALSDFEHFKVWLLKLVSQKNISILEGQWKTKLDVAWLDIFWNNKGEDSYDVDDSYLLYFKLSYMADYIKTLTVNSSQFSAPDEKQHGTTHDDIVVILEKLRNNENYFDPESSFCSVFGQNLPKYLSILDHIEGAQDRLHELNEINGQDFGRKYIDCDPAEHLFGERSKGLTWWGAAWYYAVMAYISKCQKGLLEYTIAEQVEFQRFSRVAMNLIYNIRIEAGPIYLQVITAIDILIADCFTKSVGIYTLLATKTEPISGMDVAQSKEECRKSRLILRDPSWESRLIKAENNLYFYGQIDFILNLSDEDSQRFEHYFERLNALFSHHVLANPSHLLQRAMLTKGKYLFPKGQNLSFFVNNYGTLRERNENWRNLFDDPLRLQMLKNLLDDDLFDHQNISNSLLKIICKRAGDISDYTKRFILNHRLIDFSKTRLIREWDNKAEKNIYILNASRISGIFFELHTLDVYMNIHDHYQQIYQQQYPQDSWEEFIGELHKITYYKKVKGGDNEPSIEMMLENKISINRDAHTHHFNIIIADELTCSYQDEHELIEFIISSLNPSWTALMRAKNNEKQPLNVGEMISEENSEIA